MRKKGVCGLACVLCSAEDCLGCKARAAKDDYDLLETEEAVIKLINGE